MTWAEPGWFWWLGLVVVVAVAAVWMGRRHLARLQSVFGAALFARVLPVRTRQRRVLRDIALVVGLGLLVLALAEPRFGKRLQQVEARGVDLVIALDLSRSMDARDVDPSRLERARREIVDLIQLFEGDRVGLVMYAGGAYPRMPLTLDYRALELMVRELDTRTFESQGSNLEAALKESARLLGNQAGQAGQAVIVLTDGEVHEPEPALEAARALASEGIVVYGLLIGSDPAPIPDDASFLVDPSTGARVITTPTDATLSQVARITGGAVVRSVASNEDALALYRDRIRTTLQDDVGRSTQRASWSSAFQWPLTAGTLLLLLSGWIGDGRRIGLVLAALLVALPAHAAPNDGSATSVYAGDAAYRARQFHEAIRIFTDLTLEHPDDADLYERLGAAQYRVGDYNGAARSYGRASELSDDPASGFNQGNAQWKSGRLDQAQQSYERVLAEHPDHEPTAKNLETLARELAQRQVQQQKQEQSEQKPSDDPKGEGEPQDGSSEGEEGQQTGEQQPQEGGDQGQGSEGQPEEPPGADPQGEQGEQEPSQSPGQQPQGGESPNDHDAPPTAAAGEAGDPTDERDANADEGIASLDEVQDTDAESTEGEGSGGGGGGDTPAELASGEMTKEQADRVLDGVEEGRPRPYFPGKRTDKPW